MSSPEHLTWWPVPDGQPIGEEHASELAAHIRDRAEPVIAIARAYLTQRYPTMDIKVHNLRSGSLAKLTLKPAMVGITIGSVTAGDGSNAHRIQIGLNRNGRITADLSKSSEPVMRSVSM